MTKFSHGTRKLKPVAVKVKLTKRNVKKLFNRNENMTTTRFGTALKRLAPLVSKVERLVDDDIGIISDLQAELSIHLGEIRLACEKAIEKYKEEETINENQMRNNKPKGNAINDLLANFSAMAFL